LPPRLATSQFPFTIPLPSFAAPWGLITRPDMLSTHRNQK
jgi:hypothetical protein